MKRNKLWQDVGIKGFRSQW